MMDNSNKLDLSTDAPLAGMQCCVQYFSVQPIEYSKAMQWCLNKHYARRKPMYQFAFALVHKNDEVQGVVVYGRPPVQIEKSVFTQPIISEYKVYELTRLVIQTEAKNAASFLVGNSLRMLPKNNIVVSYADSNMSHCGIVYQATNWIYTGSNKAHDSEYIVDGKKMHPKTITERLGITAIAKWAKANNIETIKPKEKHRYFFINADKKTKADMIKKLRYPIIKEYPKCDKKMYDAGELISMKIKDVSDQQSLF
jgi:hypothetical protein